MKTKLLLSCLALGLSVWLNSPFSNARAQGSLTPPGAPAPTMKSLAQIEPRLALTNSGPLTISQSGSYYLTTNIYVTAAANSNGIIVAANNVALDLCGFSIFSTSPTAAGSGIYLSGTLTNISIVNGFIYSGITNNGATNYGAGGFAYGIYSPSNNLVNVHVSNLSVAGCLYHGIFVLGPGTLVKSCSVSDAGTYGIYADGIADSIATGCGNAAIVATSTASNCRGASYEGNGITATTALNCVGQSSAAYGVDATTANGCYGTSTNSYGIFAYALNNCYGTSINSVGIYSQYTAMNCIGATGGSSYGIYSTGVVTGCYGATSSGVGLLSVVATSSIGVNGGGSVSESITYKNSMP